MKIVKTLVAPVLALTIFGPVDAASRQKVPPAQVETWAACAVEKNADDITWMYMLASDQSGLTGPARDGAIAMAVFLMARDCAPANATFDNDLIDALTKRSVALWNGDTKKHSASRPTDAWADCMAIKEPARSRGYLFARDLGFAGPKLIVEGVDPIVNFFAPTSDCDTIRPKSDGEIDRTSLYARLNYLVRVRPRVEPTAVPAKGAR